MSELGPTDSEAEEGWEEVVPTYEEEDDNASPAKPLEITIQAADTGSKKKNNEKSERSKKLQAERVIRVESHKFHLVCLLKSASIRNKWINDPLLHARLLSLTPLALQNAFPSITKKRVPDQARRGRLFEGAVMRLTEWWYSTFEVEEAGHIKSRTFRQAEEDAKDETFSEQFEVLRTSKSLMKHALMRRGSRDCSSILFASLCRALLIPSRLVVSLQPVPWQANVGRPKEKAVDIKGKGKAKAVSEDESEPVMNVDEDDEDDDMEEVGIPTPSDDAASSSSPQLSVSSSFEDSPKPSPSKKSTSLRRQVIKTRRRKNGLTVRPQQKLPPLGGWPPTMWVEVFSRADSRWLPVDPVRYIVNKKKLMEPPAHDVNNRMSYVVALEEDGFARDVTRRYASEYQAKTLKTRVGVRNGQEEWWSQVMSMLARPYRLQRDELEDEELDLAKYREGMPNSIAGFKNHPLYVLERHLKQTEVIYPKEEVGKFRGESVYPRTHVIPLKTSENWTRMGRKVKEGCQPLKMVKAHAMTVNRRRAIEMAKTQGDEIGMQGLYALDQTELYIPDPVIDGKVPKNDFGNIDLYTSSMLPQGAAHIPFQGVAKVARAIGIDYAEAVTGFDFRQGRAYPVLTGIVVAAENEELVVEAYLESAQNEEERLRIRTRDKVLKLWSKLINGLRIHQRVREDYGGKDRSKEGQDTVPEELPGGFITEAGQSIAGFSLPKGDLDPGLRPASPPADDSTGGGFDFTLAPALPPIGDNGNNWKEYEQHSEATEDVPRTIRAMNGIPITMESLAESERARLEADGVGQSESGGGERGQKRGNRPVRRQPRRSNRHQEHQESTEISDISDRDAPDPKQTPTRHSSRSRFESQPSARRSLRPRKPKSQLALDAEREAEKALRDVLEVDSD